MIPVARRLLFRNRGGLIVTVAGVAATISLLLFLFAVHDGVRDGSTRYVSTAGVDIWVSQKNSDNILKSSSFLSADLALAVGEIEGVALASPLTRVITKADVNGRRSSTLFILAFDPETNLGAPATVSAGSARLDRGEIVLDRSFVKKYELGVGSTLEIQGRAFTVKGISEGTNALVSQFGFTRRDDAAAILGLENTASFILVTVRDPDETAAVGERIRRQFPDLAVHEAADFIRFHHEEMQSGVLPVFAAAAVFGAFVCALIVALMLYNSVLARREDYATLKALGASQRWLVRIIVTQALIVTALGCAGGAAILAAVTPLLAHVVPALSLRYEPQLLLVLPAALLVGAVAALAPVGLLKRIYPGEVFRA
jgi:putative ABC transport system permease protein